ncbi:MAG TPA: PhoH family protein [Candidatus Latescibacteria bacterium]|nr:PhoH family protein [Candidatus Latescibacterota bacterium]HOS63591.1 PhoH family protein [Candidatus Latescibacterota bacterium]HPK73341.1 PhoH family protein [Candidatus Latescibacterota bacterium]HRU23742.1 PhoH family protein [Candidatus Latescibacterota bacterium]
MRAKAQPLLTQSIDIEGADIQHLFGPLDRNRKELEEEFHVSLVSRQGQLLVRGTEAEVAAAVKELDQRLRGDFVAPGPGTASPVALSKKRPGEGHPPTGSPAGPVILHTTNRVPISPRSRGQRDYCEAIARHDIVFGIGPAGTGKTYLAVAMAVAALKKREVTRVILARPAVEAGESLGFLPGDLKEKVDPYLRPLYDALHEMIPPDKLKNYLETHVIEIVPLAFMRGRTLNSAFVILDEAQNTTTRQMKMFLTRLGADSKAVITGDITQIDLPAAVPSGLIDAKQILSGITGISFVSLSERDVVRHRLVQLIIRAYDRVESSHGASNNANQQGV